jgi:hypothetical protein
MGEKTYSIIQSCGGENLKERGNLEENLSVDGRIIFKWL